MKEQISSAYLEDKKSRHGSKKFPEDRKILITGVSNGNIGEGIAERMEVVGEVRVIREDEYDLTNSLDAAEALRSMPDIDTLILCHGYTNLDWVEDQQPDQIAKMISVNLTSHINLISGFARMTIDANYKKTILVIGSMAASAVLNGSSPYCAAKAGLQHFIKCVAWELAPKGFDVYIINPSNVENSPMSDQTIRDLARYRVMSMAEAVEYWSANNPRSGFLSKDEIADLTLHLVRGWYPYLSGTPLNLGGGQR